MRPPRPTAEQWARLLDDLAADRQCTEEGQHLGCAAAQRMADLDHLPKQALAALEASVSVADRAPCVQHASIRALAADGSPLATLALHRMRSVLRRRLEWDGDPRDRELLGALTSAMPPTLTAG